MTPPEQSRGPYEEEKVESMVSIYEAPSNKQSYSYNYGRHIGDYEVINHESIVISYESGA
jgi:hypothetical protein